MYLISFESTQIKHKERKKLLVITNLNSPTLLISIEHKNGCIVNSWCSEPSSCMCYTNIRWFIPLISVKRSEGRHENFLRVLSKSFR